mgnify:FL=1
MLFSNGFTSPRPPVFYLGVEWRFYSTKILTLTTFIHILYTYISRPFRWNSGKVMAPQVGPAEGNVSVSTAETKIQNLRFKDRVEPYMYSVASSVDSTRTAHDSDQAPLGDFLKRPVKIAEFDWGIGTELLEDFDPWSLFFNSPRVINRISNFNLLRANLHLRILINGNPFQYGRCLMYYRPLDVFDQLSSDAGFIGQDLIAGSQCPHIYLDPTTSQGGELMLPFFWHKNYFSITDSEWKNAGRIYLRSLNALKHATGALGVSTITVMAWAEDTQMSVLTSVNPTLITPQMGEFEEANSKGFISGPATTIAKVAGALKVIPWIRPYAMASEYVANGVAQAAKIFGFCRPTDTSQTIVRPSATCNLALSNVVDTSQKLSVDAKQEITVDPRISGIESLDPLNIRGIASRESYLTTFTWAVGTDPDSLLWNVRPNPMMYDTSGGAAFHFTALAMTALPFQKWTGSLRYRFQIVASNYHRGRLRFIWDPNYIVEPTSNYNITHSTIIDIADERDFTMEIANGQDFTLLESIRSGFPTVSTADSFGTSTFTAKRLSTSGIPEHNGTLGVYVLNELTVPDSEVNNDVQINVFVSAGDDYEVAVPVDDLQAFAFKPQSGLVEQADPTTTEPSAPLQYNSVQFTPEITESPNFNSVFTGEAIASFRPLLKRFALHTTLQDFPTGTLEESVIAGTLPAFPYLRGNVSGAVDATVNTTPYNYANTLLLHFVTAGFAGWRGSMRWKFLPRGYYDAFRSAAYVARNRAEPSITKFARVRREQLDARSFSEGASGGTAEFPYSVATTANSQAPPVGSMGTAYTHCHVNPALEVEVPFYSSYRFVPGKVEDYTTGSNTFTGPGLDYRFYTVTRPSACIDCHCAAGDDFQVYFWTGLPRMYYEPSNPAPSPAT